MDEGSPPDPFLIGNGNVSVANPDSMLAFATLATDDIAEQWGLNDGTSAKTDPRPRQEPAAGATIEEGICDDDIERRNVGTL